MIGIELKKRIIPQAGLITLQNVADSGAKAIMRPYLKRNV
jgi:hypothetical protein